MVLPNSNKRQKIFIKKTICHGNPLRNPIIIVNEKGETLELEVQDKYFLKYILGNLNIKFDQLYNVISELDEIIEEVNNIEKECIQSSKIADFLTNSKIIMVTENWEHITSAKKEWAETVLKHCLNGYSEMNAKSLATHQCRDNVISEMNKAVEQTAIAI